jgi:nitroreductase
VRLLAMVVRSLASSKPSVLSLLLWFVLLPCPGRSRRRRSVGRRRWAVSPGWCSGGMFRAPPPQEGHVLNMHITVGSVLGYSTCFRHLPLKDRVYGLFRQSGTILLLTQKG